MPFPRCPLLLAASVLLLASCAVPTDPGWQRVVGVIAPELSSSQVLSAPAAATAGTPFTVTVTTVGSSSCTRPDGASASVTGLTAEITPFDRTATGASACTDDLRPFPREVTLRFTTPGEAVVRVRARGLGSQPALVEARVAVLP